MQTNANHSQHLHIHKQILTYSQMNLTPPCLPLMQVHDKQVGMGRRTRKDERGRRRRVGLTYMPITPSFKTIPKVIKILILGSNHPMELIMRLLDKITEGSMLKLDINPKEHLLLLDGPYAGVYINAVLKGRLG